MTESLSSVDKNLLKDLLENLNSIWTVSAIDVKMLLKDCDWVIDKFFIIYYYNAVSSFFRFIDSKRFNTYPSLSNIFNVFIERFSEIYFSCPFKKFWQTSSVGLVIIAKKIFWFTKFEYILFFFLAEFCKSCVIHGLVRNSNYFFVKLLSNACVSNRPSILNKCWFIEKLTSLFSLHKICLQSIWLKSEINLFFSDFLQLLLVFLRKNLLKK